MVSKFQIDILPLTLKATLNIAVQLVAQNLVGCIVVILFLAIFSLSVEAQQLPILKKMPAELLDFTGGARPNAEGMVGYNRDGFRSPEFQRGAMHFMIRSIVKGDRQGIDDAWRAIDATFARQTDIGTFARDGGPVGGPSAVAFWLCELDQAILILRESSFGPEYKTRIEKLIPQIHKSALWLAQSKYQTRLEREDGDTPNRLLFDALAFGLSGMLTEDRELQQTGRRFVDLAMKLYREEDGVFLEKGGHDSSYQAVAALKLQIWLIYFPDEKLDLAVNKAVRWQIGRVLDNGGIDVAGNTRTGLKQERWMGNFKDVNLSEITLCLLYHNARTNNPDSLSAARRIVEKRKG